MQRTEHEDPKIRVTDDEDHRRVKDRRTSRSSTAAPALIVGSLILIVASFLDWIDGRELAITDPNVPPLPPLITLEQAKHFAMSIWSGDAEALGFVKQTVKDAADTVLPHKSR